MEEALVQLGLGVSWTTVTIHRLWSDVVGEEVARRSQPGLMRNGRLHVTVSDAVWLQQLMFLKPTILASLEARLGSRVVRELFFTVGILSFDSSPLPASPHERGSTTVPAEMEAHLHEVLQPIQDGECRSVLARILKKAWQPA